MSHTSTLQNYSILLLLIIATLLFTVSSPGTVSRAGTQPLNVAVENEISLEPTEENVISDHNSQVTLAYETGVFEIETSSEFELEGLSDVELLVGAGKDPIETECELTFDSRQSKLETYKLTGDIQLDSKTSLSLEYESDYPEEGETADPEKVFTVERELTEDLSLEVEGEFSEPERKLTPVPTETKVDLSGLDLKNFVLDTALEFENTELKEIEFDFEGKDSLFDKPGLILKGTVILKPSEDIVEFDPEFELEFGDLSLETILYLSDETRISKLELVEVSLDDLEFAGWDLELSNDFESGESEITFERDSENLDVEFEFAIKAEANGNPLNLGQRTGGLTWYPEEFLSATIEIESGPSSPPEFSLTSEYEF